MADEIQHHPTITAMGFMDTLRMRNCVISSGFNNVTGYDSLDDAHVVPVVDTANIYTADPILSLPADNGGPVPTIAIGAGGSAIDHGIDGQKAPVGVIIPMQDARGVIRPQGAGIDIGAFEKE
jgi:hypothetical protein